MQIVESVAQPVKIMSKWYKSVQYMGVSIKLGRRVTSLSTSFLHWRERLWGRNGSLPWRGKIFSQAMILGYSDHFRSEDLQLSIKIKLLKPDAIPKVVAPGPHFLQLKVGWHREISWSRPDAPSFNEFPLLYTSSKHPPLKPYYLERANKLLLKNYT